MKILNRHYALIILPILVFLIYSCSDKQAAEPVKIGISKALPEEYYGNYARWIARADSNIICIDLYHMPVDSALGILEDCSGLLISGGPDVYPGRYGQEDDTIKCDPADFFRDTLEWSLIAKAKEMQMPVMGICRGLQIFNVFHGGSLYPDIPTDLDTLVRHRCKDWLNCDHWIAGVPEGSGLFSITQQENGIVNTNHHQGIDRLGNGLAAVAWSEDGLIEAIEYQDRQDMPFFLGVQWHPERMDTLSAFSMPVARAFVGAVHQYNEQKMLKAH